VVVEFDRTTDLPHASPDHISMTRTQRSEELFVGF
jgi:hypothetical protein